MRVSGDLYHPVIPPGAVCVGRQGFGLRRSPWANLYSARVYGRTEALRLYRQWLHEQPELIELARKKLPGVHWRAGARRLSTAMPTGCWRLSAESKPVLAGGPHPTMADAGPARSDGSLRERR
ncbi:hypothetical protein Ato02nite_018260 [Paractinoplanes toevensis]|uniref:Uncharacterized protein n=1 Tax=Paractinoplanes toevensis TaxID=571911 RepID=A0A919W4F3_9ACTN|nr:hypothetical protein Ato02nite_018260 [Actinoplanes toevensis]